MKDNIDMFIGAYKPFKPPVVNKVYKIIVGNHDIDINTDLEVIKCGNKDDVLDDKFYSEIYMLKYLVKHRELKDYVGFCHYRKYFSFMDDIPDMDDKFNKCDAIIINPITYKYPLAAIYGAFHNIDDLFLVGKVIKDKKPEYFKSFLKMCSNRIFIPYNMVIMKREDYIRYIEFITEVLDEYVKIVGTDINGRIESIKDKYLKGKFPNNTVDYQYRIGGYLAERLTNVFIRKNFKKIITYPVKITEKKY